MIWFYGVFVFGWIFGWGCDGRLILLCGFFGWLVFGLLDCGCCFLFGVSLVLFCWLVCWRMG